MNVICGNALAGIDLLCGIGKRVVTEAGKKVHLRPQPRSGDCLICALAAGAHVEQITNQRLAHHRLSRDAHGQAHDIAANHCYFWHSQSSASNHF